MTNKETLFYVPRGFVGSDKQAQDFANKHSDYLLNAQRIIEIGKLPVKLALKTTFIDKSKHDWGVTQESSYFFDLGIKKLREAGIDYSVDTWASGPTKTMYETIFNQGILAEGFASIATGDLDQFPAHENIQNLLNLHERVKKENAIMGMGSRNLPVVLSSNPENAYLRRIFEGVMNISVKIAADISKNKIFFPENYKVPGDEAYTFTGDMITGFYLINPSHLRASELANTLVSTARENNFFMFENEYLMAIASATMGNLSIISATSVTNPFEPADAKAEREKIIKKQIQSPLEKLVGTCAEPFIKRSIADASCLNRFYKKEQVEEVTAYMSEALNK